MHIIATVCFVFYIGGRILSDQFEFFSPCYLHSSSLLGIRIIWAVSHSINIVGNKVFSCIQLCFCFSSLSILHVRPEALCLAVHLSVHAYIHIDYRAFMPVLRHSSLACFCFHDMTWLRNREDEVHRLDFCICPEEENERIIRTNRTYLEMCCCCVCLCPCMCVLHLVGGQGQAELGNT